MKSALALLTLLASPAFAQDDRVLSASQMSDGIAACLASKADPAMLTTALSSAGWTNAPDAYGTLIFTPSDGDNTLVMRPSDATQCRVESMDLNTETAGAVLVKALATAGITVASKDADDLGCPRLQLGNGATATPVSGDDNTACTSTETSAIRFEFAAAP